MHDPNFDRRAVGLLDEPPAAAAAPGGEAFSILGDAIHEMTMSLLWPLRITEAVIEMSANFTHGIYRGQGVRFGDGKPVIVVAGRLSGDIALTPLRLWLEAIGYRPVGSVPLVGVDDRLMDDLLATAVQEATRRVGRKGVLLAFDIGVRSALRVAAIHSDAISDVIAVAMPSRLPMIPHNVRLHVIERADHTNGKTQDHVYRVRGSEMILSINPEGLRIIAKILREIAIELL